MASVFKRGGKRAKGYWYAKWLDADGKWRTRCTKTTCKQSAKRVANKLEADAVLRRDGVVDSVQELFAIEAKRSLEEHVSEFVCVLAARDNTDKHVAMTEARTWFIITACAASTIDQLTSSAVQQALQEIRATGRSLETCNSYLRAIKSFTRWMWRDKRAADDSLSTLEAFNAASDQRHPRREFTPEELVFFLAFVAGQPNRRTT